MKKLLTLTFLLGILFQASAQLTSVKALKDLKKDDNCYDAVKNLIEKYNALGTVEIRQANKYLADGPLTHRDFAIVLVQSLDNLRERFDKLATKKNLSTRDSLFEKFTKKYYKGYSDSAVKDLEGYAQYKDVNNDDPDYAAIKKLTNFYHLKLGDTYNTFAPDKPLTEKELSKIFGDYFGMRSLVPRASNTTTTRGKWAMSLDALLERLYDAAADLATSN